MTSGRRIGPRQSQHYKLQCRSVARTSRCAADGGDDGGGIDAAALLPRMAVFEDGATPGAASAICSGESVGTEEFAALLSTLAERALLEVIDRGGERRYRLSEVDRAAARRELATAGELEAVRARHAAYYAG